LPLRTATAARAADLEQCIATGVPTLYLSKWLAFFLLFLFLGLGPGDAERRADSHNGGGQRLATGPGGEERTHQAIELWAVHALPPCLLA
jgi:hypothetical protein